jgi:hypothetical protein
MKKWLSVLVLLFLFAAVGFYREIFFRYTNSWISVVEWGYPEFPLKYGMGFLKGMSLGQLHLLKWLATCFFAFVFLGIGLFGIWLFFPKRRNYWYCLILYGSAFVFAAIAMAVGKIIPAIQELSYSFSRWIMGAAQSPVLFMLLSIFLIGEKQLIQKQESPSDSDPSEMS